jgi:hypothetical protein
MSYMHASRLKFRGCRHAVRPRVKRPKKQSKSSSIYSGTTFTSISALSSGRLDVEKLGRADRAFTMAESLGKASSSSPQILRSYCSRRNNSRRTGTILL